MRLIDANVLEAKMEKRLAYLRKEYGDYDHYTDGYEECFCMAEEAPTVDESDEYKRGEWEMFERLSSAYWTKQMYFLNEDGTVYSRYSCKSMTKDEAFCEFLERIAED